MREKHGARVFDLRQRLSLEFRHKALAGLALWRVRQYWDGVRVDWAAAGCRVVPL